MTDANLDRFSGFAELYDAVRPSPPPALGALLSAYAGTRSAEVVDLGSGTGLSSRWAAGWAGSVTGIEPNDDMRAIAESRIGLGLVFRKGTASATGLDAASADVVIAVQALHWMEPEPTFTEVARVLRPGGVFAAVDADWPPVAGSARAERAWVALDRRIALLEQRQVAGEDLHAPLGADPDTLGTLDVWAGEGAVERGRGVRSWGKEGHLGRMASSGRFAFTREVLLHAPIADGPSATPGGGAQTHRDAQRFVALMRSQGSYQQLRRAGVDDDELGMPQFEDAVRVGFSERPVPFPLSISWRVRLGVAG